MNEKLVLDYMKAHGTKIYDDSDTILDLRISGDVIFFKEESSCGHYRDERNINVIDIIAWVYSLTLKKTI